MKTKTTILVGFIIAKLVLHFFLIHPVYDLQRDEYLHLDQANHLAWGYISVPPVTSWIAYIIKLLGNEAFWVKFFPALFGALTLLVVWKIIEELKGGLFSLVLGSTAILFSVLLRVNILFQPNSLDIFFWTLTYFTIIKFINTENSRWLFATGIAIAFGILSKYNMIFLLLGLIPAAFLTKHRKIFAHKHLYISIGLVLLLIMPNLWWQWQNNFPTYYQLHELSDTQLINVNRIDFVKEQLLYFLNVVVILVAAFLGFFIYPPFKKYRLFFWSYVFTITIFILLKAKSYYAIGLYPVLIAFGSVYLEKILSEGKRKYFKPALIAVVILIFAPFLFIAFPTRSPVKIQKNNKLQKDLGLLRWEDGVDHELPMDFADMVGWKDLAADVDSVYSRLEEKEHTIVFCDNYGQAGAINYYSVFPEMNAVTLNADYINWIQLEKEIRNVILVQEAGDDDPTREREKPWFDSVQLVGENDNPFSREMGTKIYLCKDALTDINKIIAAEIVKYKNRN